MTFSKTLTTFAMKKRSLVAMKAAQVYHWHSCFSSLLMTHLFALEPFLFGPYEDTDECTESCQLLQRRTCEEVNPRSSCKTRSRRGLEKRSAIVYPVQVSDFFLSVRYKTFCLTRSLRIWKLDRVRVHWGLRKSWGFEANTRMQGKWQHHELLPRCTDGQDHWETLQQRIVPNYDCRLGKALKNRTFVFTPLQSAFRCVFLSLNMIICVIFIQLLESPNLP